MNNLENTLALANGKNRSRLLSVQKATALIEYAEEEARKLPEEIRTSVIFQYAEGVPNSYKYRATSTWLIVTFNTDGSVNTVSARRLPAPHKPYGADVCRFHLPLPIKVEGFRGAYKQL